MSLFQQVKLKKRNAEYSKPKVFLCSEIVEENEKCWVVIINNVYHSSEKPYLPFENKVWLHNKGGPIGLKFMGKIAECLKEFRKVNMKPIIYCRFKDDINLAS